MNVAFYVRVSTPRQQQTHTSEQQLTRLQSVLTEHPDWQLNQAHIYRDEGYSGSCLNRPALDRLRDQAQTASFERILITAPDRLARNYVHQMLLIDEFEQLGCPVEFVDRPMSNDPHDQLLLQIRGAVAEYERTLIRDRMRRGRLAKLQAGQLIPWTRPPYGYLLDVERPRDPSRVRLDEAKAAIVRQIFAWYTDPAVPATLYWVAKQLNKDGIPPPRGGARWCVATIRAILRDWAYTGTAYAGRTQAVSTKRRRSALGRVGKGTRRQQTEKERWIAIGVPAIVTEEVFELAQARLDRNKQMARRNNKTQDYLLRGLVSCGLCRLSCSGRTSGRYRYYVCDGHRERARVERGERCRSRFTPVEVLDELVWQDVCRVLREPALIRHELYRLQAGVGLPEALRARRQTVVQALAHVERQQGRLLDV
jgi:site-specific DNA recombinase